MNGTAVGAEDLLVVVPLWSCSSSVFKKLDRNVDE